MLFDLDGTLVDSRLDFATIRRDLEIPPGQGVLETLRRLPPAEAAAKWAILDAHELAGAEAATLLPGAVDLIQWLTRRAIPVGILTRNSRPVAERTCLRLNLRVPLLITRDDAPAKPDPAGILSACASWRLTAREVVLVGDYVYDLQTARNAGCRGVLYLGGRNPAELDYAATADLWLDCFSRPQGLLDWLDRSNST